MRFLRRDAEHPQLPGASSIEVWQYRGMGSVMMKFLYERVKSRGIEVLYSTPARELITNPKGEVVGIVGYDEVIKRVTNIKASKAVILS